MNQPAPKDDAGAPPDAAESEATGLPGFRKWSTVYWFVTGVFAAVVVLLTALSRMFS